MNFQEFINKTLGKAIDVDGQYSCQCVDLFNYFNKLYNNGVYINCRPSGYARSIAQNKANNGLLNYYTETTVNNMIFGTVVVWGDCRIAPKSHVGFFLEDNGNGTFKCLQQNAPKPYTTINNMPYDGIIGAFIPKQLIRQEQPKEADQVLSIGSRVKFNGMFKVTCLDIPHNLFGSTQLTGRTVASYHWLPSEDFTEVDGNGNPTQDQMLGIGSLVKNDKIYTVQATDKKSNSAMLNINGRTVWVFSGNLVEISDK